MKGIAEKQNICRFAKMFMIVGAVGSLNACVDDIATVTPDDNTPEVTSPSTVAVVIGSTCSDGIDNDHDGWQDAQDPDCFASPSADELGFSSFICNNGLDDDGDAAVDSDDANCQSATDDTESLAVGDILITEFMANPLATSDTVGEWFEVYNNTAADIDLNGWTIADAGSSHIITENLLVPAGDYAVLSRGDDGVNGLSQVSGTDYVYGSSLYFSNSGDEIHVIDPQGLTIDSIIYTAANVASGASTIINGNSWCVSTQLISGGAGDLGSPGLQNETCL